MEFDGIRLETDGRVTTITLARPQRRNALSLDMLQNFIKAFEAVPPESGVVVLAAEGPAFSAGHDMSEMIDRPDDYYSDLFGTCGEMMEAIHRLSQPVIAKVQGIATAAGCQLVASCDLAVAADTAWFATPGVSIGLFAPHQWSRCHVRSVTNEPCKCSLPESLSLHPGLWSGV